MFAGRFQGRTAIVTGAASGIGRDVADRLRAEGAVVSLWDSNEEALSRRRDELGGADIQVVDIASEQAVDLAMKRSVAALGGRLDILIAGAGISGPNRATKDYSGEDWRRVIDINLNGTFYCNRAAVREMGQTGYGRIVNIASVAGKEGNPNASAYSASKASVIGLTKSLGKELASTDVRINCITPAAIRTPIFDQMAPEHIDFMLSKIPIGRFGRVEEVTALVLWLASVVQYGCCVRLVGRSGYALGRYCRVVRIQFNTEMAEPLADRLSASSRTWAPSKDGAHFSAKLTR